MFFEKTLKILNLSKNDIGADGVNYLVHALTNNTVGESFCSFRLVSSQRLCLHLNLLKLNWWCRNENSIGNEGLRHLMKALKINTV